MSRQGATHLPFIKSYCTPVCDCCVSPADKVCARRSFGNTRLLGPPRPRLAPGKHVNKHNETPQSHICQWKEIILLAWASGPKLCEGSKKLIMNWRHVVEHFPNIFFSLYVRNFFWLFSSNSVLFPRCRTLPLAPQLCVHGQQEPFAPAWIPWIAITALEKHITKHN